MISTDDTALLTVLLSKHITSCDNVFLKEYFLLATYGEGKVSLGSRLGHYRLGWDILSLIGTLKVRFQSG